MCVSSSKSGWEYRLERCSGPTSEVLSENQRYFFTNQIKVFSSIFEVNDIKVDLQK